MVFAATALRVQPLEGGRSLVFAAAAGQNTLTVRDSSGAVAGSSSHAGPADAVIDAHGRVTQILGSGGSYGRLVQYDLQGRRIYSVPTKVGPPTLSAPAVGDDGSVFLLGQTEGQHSMQRNLWAVAPDGATRWITPLEDYRFAFGRLMVRGDAVFALEDAAYSGAGSLTQGIVSKLAIADGRLLWRYESFNSQYRYPSNQAAGRLVTTAAGDALLVHSWGNRLRFQRLDGASGALLQDQFVACDKFCTPPSALSVAADGTARLAATVTSPDGQTALLQAFPGMDRDPPRTRLDQPGVSGLWYSPYANGEGLSIDWLPDTRTLFAAWFTYSTGGDNNPAGQRWYTLQADAAAGARLLELSILRTEGGNFDAGPRVTPRRIGSAKLQFTDCNNASLNYTFDDNENGGARGAITLSRLTPATQPCILADGSSIPGAGARPPSKGFDARMSGAWYDESAPGQGLQLNIQPDGVFFAPWFAYDPQEQQPGNDPYRQHWFTLQGNLAQAVEGSVEALLVQTIGGLFDRVPTDNAYAVGTATLRMNGCDRASLEYRFANDERAGPYANRSGTLALVKIGGCIP
jgi:hypothetical protein